MTAPEAIADDTAAVNRRDVVQSVYLPRGAGDLDTLFGVVPVRALHLALETGRVP